MPNEQTQPAPAPDQAPPPPPPPLYGKDGRLSRDGMERVISAGGSVAHNGAVIARVSDLPSAADLAKASGDADAVERIRAGKQAEIQRLQAELDGLPAPAPAAADDGADAEKKAAAEKAAAARKAEADRKAAAERAEADRRAAAARK